MTRSRVQDLFLPSTSVLLTYCISLGTVVLWVLLPAVHVQSARKTRSEGVLGVLFVKYERALARLNLPVSLEVQAVKPAYPLVEVIVGKQVLPASVQSLQNMYRVEYAADVLPKKATRLMPINASCDDNYEGDHCFFGEGIIYAAPNGADIINAGYGSAEILQTEVDAIQPALDLGALVIAAVPNEYHEIQAFPDYPSSLPTTLSVSATHYYCDEITDAAYGYSVDIIASAKNVFGTMPGGEDVRREGTSFAFPMVSGVAALVKMAYANFTPQQIGEQLWATADDMDAANVSSLAGLLGRGRVNAYRAVTEQNAASVRMIDWKFTDSNGDCRFDAE